MFPPAMTSTMIQIRATAKGCLGDRIRMEDVFCWSYEDTESEGGLGMFAVFDGHAGVQAAEFVSRHLWLYVKENDDFYSDDVKVVGESIQQAFLRTQEEMRQEVGKLLN